MPTVRYNRKDVKRLYSLLLPAAQVMDLVGLHMAQQVKTRFATHGASAGIPWAGKAMAAFGYHDGRAILTGASGELLNSFYGYGEGSQAIAASDCQHSLVHQLGTVGKGGKLPDIRPKRAKALFIPITDKAIHSERLNPQDANAWANILGQPVGKQSTRARRFGVTHHATESGGLAVQYSPLRKGRLKDGRLEVLDDVTGEYVPGTPDFIFLRKVSIPARPMLPTSSVEIEETLRFMLNAMIEQKRSRRIDAQSNPRG